MSTLKTSILKQGEANLPPFKTKQLLTLGLIHTPLKEYYVTTPILNKRSAVVLYELTDNKDKTNKAICGYNVVFLRYKINAFDKNTLYHAHPTSSKWGVEALSVYTLSQAEHIFNQFKAKL